MMLGLTLAQFTVLHVAISMVAIFAGFVVIGGLLSNHGLSVATAIFLVTTILTNVTGFQFPFSKFTPALAVGTLSSIILLISVFALYRQNLKGHWRSTYIVSATAALYLNVFVMIVQSFQKVTFLQPLAPTGSEPAFIIAQAATLITFLIMGGFLLVKSHPHPAS